MGNREGQCCCQYYFGVTFVNVDLEIENVCTALSIQAFV